jgi:hypothetical protein
LSGTPLDKAEPFTAAMPPCSEKFVGIEQVAGHASSLAETNKTQDARRLSVGRKRSAD